MPSLLFSANKSRQYYTRYNSSTSEFLIEYSFLFLSIVQIPFSIDLFFVRKKKKTLLQLIEEVRDFA